MSISVCKKKLIGSSLYIEAREKAVVNGELGQKRLKWLDLYGGIFGINMPEPSDQVIF